MRETDNARMFSKIAHRYDLLNRVLSFNIDRRWRRKAVSAANLPRGGRVLDACTGTGDVAIDFMRYSEPSAVVGVDLSGEMIRVARKKVIAPEKVIAPNHSTKRRETNGCGIQLVEGSVLDLPFDGGSFDAVAIAFGLRNLTDYGRGIAEMTRVLRPGGRLVILEFAPPAHGFFQRIYGVYLRAAVPMIGALVSGNGEAYRYLATSVGDFLTRDLVLDLMGKAGLRALEAEKLTGGIAYIYSGTRV